MSERGGAVNKHTNGKVPEDNGPKVGPEAPQAKETVTLQKEEYDALLAKSKECDAFHDKFLREQAEYENLRKRLEREKAEFMRYAKEEFLLEFMPILDSIEMASRHTGNSSDAKALHEGLGMIELQVKKFLKDLGVERLKTVGEKFDPHLHEAVEVVEVGDKEENLVVEELKAGYTLNGKLIRPAAVKIAGKAAQKEKEG